MNNKLYKHLNYYSLTFETYYNYEILEVLGSTIDFNVTDKHILHYRELKQGYNQYTSKENNDYYNFKEE